jgi:Stage II sporulation protein E (SpoIIE)
MDRGIDFAAIGILSVLILSYFFFVVYLRGSGMESFRMRNELAQAQEVQQLILPESRLAFPGLVVESEYRPAREVGGDFFQMIPHKTDGSLLIVAGDVAGKGLKAGMLVALLVGAIRTAAQYVPNPAAVLSALNLLLIGRSDAQTTCLALRISKDGAVTLANSGHIAPYLNGEPVPMEGSLPLGMIESAESSVMHFRLHDGDRLTLISDGIAEATDDAGQLFGFERVHQLLRAILPQHEERVNNSERALALLLRGQRNKCQSRVTTDLFRRYRVVLSFVFGRVLLPNWFPVKDCHCRIQFVLWKLHRERSKAFDCLFRNGANLSLIGGGKQMCGRLHRLPTLRLFQPDEESLRDLRIMSPIQNHPPTALPVTRKSCHDPSRMALNQRTFLRIVVRKDNVGSLSISQGVTQCRQEGIPLNHLPL